MGSAAIVILCGGLTNKKERQLVDPGFGLDLGMEDRTPILDWHLRQLNDWMLKENVQEIPVLLPTTSETRDVVAGCCNRYKAQVKKRTRTISVFFRLQPS